MTVNRRLLLSRETISTYQFLLQSVCVAKGSWFLSLCHHHEVYAQITLNLPEPLSELRVQSRLLPCSMTHRVPAGSGLNTFCEYVQASPIDILNYSLHVNTHQRCCSFSWVYTFNSITVWQSPGERSLPVCRGFGINLGARKLTT